MTTTTTTTTTTITSLGSPSSKAEGTGTSRSQTDSQQYYIRRRRPRILLAVTGSVAAVKGPELAVRLVKDTDADVRIVLTQGGENFWTKGNDYDVHYWTALQKLLIKSSGTSKKESEGDNEEEGKDEDERRISIFGADDEWKEWRKLGDPVLHIDLRDWADLLLIAPLSAHTLAKISNGLCDDTVSCVVRAWDFGHGIRPGKPLLLAPAMNTAMWQHPLTQSQLSTIRGFWRVCDNDSCGVHIIAPQVKTLACGEVGNGALASVDDILLLVLTILRTLDSTLTVQTTDKQQS